jgi:hypothetical protein
VKKSLLLLGMISTSGLALANDAELSTANNLDNPNTTKADSGLIFAGGGSPIYSNGSLVNSPGTGVGGDDESILENLTLGMNTLGAGHQVAFDNRVADEFEVVGGDWVVDSIDFYAYQTNETASTITAVNLRIWDGVPGDPGSNVVFGDTTTNRMAGTGYSGILRVTEDTSGASTARQIAVSNVTVGITLTPGTYWLDWQSDGTGGSGPWAPPISILGQSTTGNALQSLDAGATYVALEDSGTLTGLGLPFVINGSLPPPPMVPTLSWLALAVLALLAMLMGRRFIRQ